MRRLWLRLERKGSRDFNESGKKASSTTLFVEPLDWICRQFPKKPFSQAHQIGNLAHFHDSLRFSRSHEFIPKHPEFRKHLR